MSNPSVLLTDLYQLTMMQGYYDRGMDDIASFEFFIRRLPPQRSFLVAAGLEQVVDYVNGLSFTDDDVNYLRTTGFFHDEFLEYLRGITFQGDINAMAEGTVFFAGEPILRVSAPLPIAQLVETRIINILQFQTMIASKAARMRIAASDKVLIDFGLRRAHGDEAGLLAARAGYLAGLDGTATVLAGRRFTVPIFGTMAHSFIQSHDSEMDAFRHFCLSHPHNTVLLIDTYDTLEGARKVVELAAELEQQGIRINGVRIDSGDMIELSFAVREIFDQAGLESVKIFLSSSLDEYSLEQISRADAPADGFGIGTKLTTSADYPYLDCSYKLVEYGGIGRRKRSTSKETWPGRKQVYRRYDGEGRIAEDTLTLKTDTRKDRALLSPVMEKGQLVAQLPPLEEIRRFAAEERQTLPQGLRTINRSPVPAPPLVISDELAGLTKQVNGRGH